MSDHVRRLQLRMEELIVEKVMWLKKKELLRISQTQSLIKMKNYCTSRAE
jgi:hypothetical protein